MTDRTPGRERRRAPLSAIVALLATMSGAAAAELPGLESVLADPTLADSSATGSEVLSLSAEQRVDLTRWLQRGGRLVLTGEAVGPALDSLRAHDGLRVGLGELVVDTDPAGVVPRTALPHCDILPAASRFAGAGLPGPERLLGGMALRLAIYALLLGVAYRATRSFPMGWRAAGAASLVAVFAAWPLLGSPTTAGWSQVDVVVETRSAPPLVWSAVALEADRRGETTLSLGESAWRPRVLENRGLIVSPSVEEDRASGETVALLSARRGSRARLGWFREISTNGSVIVIGHPGNDRLTGLIDNRLPRHWTDIWLLLPGRQPVRLDDLQATDALVLDLPRPAPLTEPFYSTEMILELPPSRANLLEAAIECAVPALHARGIPVLMAWSDRPLHAATLDGDRSLESGATLLITALREPV